MKISPLAVTRPDWEIYIKTVQEVLGFSPSSGLGATTIKIESPVAYLATLDLKNHPLHHLRRGYFLNNTFEHFSISFICALECDLVTALLTDFPNLNYLVRKGRKEFLVIISATVADWYLAVRRGLSSSQKEELHIFFHNLYALFVRLGFQEVWGDVEKNEVNGLTVMGPKYERTY
jgi:hypothetical protein